MSSASVGRPFRALPAAETRRCRSVDSTRVVSEVAEPKKPRHAELKGVTSEVFRERWTTFSGFGGRRNAGTPTLLIQQGLLAKVVQSKKHGMLN